MTKEKDVHAVGALQGLTLNNGWKVAKQLVRSEDATGGMHSCSYIVEKDGRKCFLKAFDFSRAFQAQDLAAALQHLTSAYLYERDLLLLCNQRKLRRVVHAVDHGEVQVPGYQGINGRVLYLIFELADNNMRGQVSDRDRMDTMWCIRALKDVAAAMRQVHGLRIAHQDTKPSNVLLFGQVFRLADFGRASREGYTAVHDHLAVAGDRTYAPPEQLYDMRDPDFNARRIGCDLYMLGNLAAFLVTGMNVTAALFDRLDPGFRPDQWNDTYANVLPYLLTAYASVMADLRKEMDSAVVVEILPIIQELCHPDLKRRGHPKGIGRYEQYSLQRYDSRLDLISKQVEPRVRARRTG
jgi:eukaryotic-like serine/threonine-protein kinase